MSRFFDRENEEPPEPDYTGTDGFLFAQKLVLNNLQLQIICIYDTLG